MLHYFWLFTCFSLLFACQHTPKEQKQSVSSDTAPAHSPAQPELIGNQTQEMPPSAPSPVETSQTTESNRAVLSPQHIPRKVKGVNPGADLLVGEKLELLAAKRVAVATNHTALLSNGLHLVDVLQKTGINLVKVFTPEHGFRGDADAGEQVASSKDKKTGLPLISLYGNNKKPTAEQLKDVDVVVFDIQDVGSRHYTYISTLTYIMEACAEQNKAVLVLDRPNPNGFYVDGPMMEGTYTSFIGMHKIPIVHGLTIGEYATMVNEEGWLKGGKKCKLSVLKCEGYKHSMRWAETGLNWVAPSPNMGSDFAAYLYPILCWYEATPVSVGRGTHDAFTLIGAPWFSLKNTESHGLKWESYNFTPVSIVGKAKNPPYLNQACKGIRFQNRTEGKQLFLAGLEILQQSYQAYQASGQDKPFFQQGFEKWAGNNQLSQQIAEGKSPEKIYDGWQAETEKFRQLRKKYLMYGE